MDTFNSSYFVCPKAHILTWAKNYISQCGLCGHKESTMSRFKCDTCQQSYCVACIKPPVMGDFCGGGHPMKHQANLTYHSCDVCRKTITGPGFRCSSCDYDVCMECHIVKED